MIMYMLVSPLGFEPTELRNNYNNIGWNSLPDINEVRWITDSRTAAELIAEARGWSIIEFQVTE